MENSQHRIMRLLLLFVLYPLTIERVEETERKKIKVPQLWLFNFCGIFQTHPAPAAARISPDPPPTAAGGVRWFTAQFRSSTPATAAGHPPTFTRSDTPKSHSATDRLHTDRIKKRRKARTLSKTIDKVNDFVYNVK